MKETFSVRWPFELQEYGPFAALTEASPFITPRALDPSGKDTLHAWKIRAAVAPDESVFRRTIPKGD